MCGFLYLFFFGRVTDGRLDDNEKEMGGKKVVKSSKHRNGAGAANTAALQAILEPLAF